MPLTKSSQTLVEEANALITTLTIDEGRALLGEAGVLFVDIRDVRELQRSGTIPGAFHGPRGMLEFWVDPQSPYYKPELGEAQRMILFCQSSWRSALATRVLQEMGVPGVAHLGGGFGAWQKAGAPVEDVKRFVNLIRYNDFCKDMLATTHVVQWGDSHVWKVGGKVFAIGGEDSDQCFRCSFKTSEQNYYFLENVPGYRPAPYMASRGMKWIQQYDAPDSEDEALRYYLKESYRLVSLGLTKKKQKELGLNQQ